MFYETELPLKIQMNYLTTDNQNILEKLELAF